MNNIPDSSWGQHGAHLGVIGPRWVPCWPHEPCYQGCIHTVRAFRWFVVDFYGPDLSTHWEPKVTTASMGMSCWCKYQGRKKQRDWIKRDQVHSYHVKNTWLLIIKSPGWLRLWTHKRHPYIYRRLVWRFFSEFFGGKIPWDMQPALYCCKETKYQTLTKVLDKKYLKLIDI